MTSDPYSVLGVSRNATQDEIKKAYRKMARKYHPDMHPDDPNAAKKMNEINEAYDMLTNPEKYEKERARQQAQEQYRNQSGYGGNGYGNSGYYGGTGYGGSGYGSSGYYGGTGYGSSGYGGYYGSFNDFFTRYGSGQYTGSINPHVQSGDSREIQRAVNLINTGQYQSALSVLSGITSSGRNARWYYLCSLAYYGGKDMTHANDYIQRACQMDPDNQTYRQVLSRVSQNTRSESSSTYSPRRGMRLVLIRLLIPIIIMLLFYGVLFRGCFGYSGYYGYGYPGYYYYNYDNSGSNTNP